MLTIILLDFLWWKVLEVKLLEYVEKLDTRGDSHEDCPYSV